MSDGLTPKGAALAAAKRALRAGGEDSEAVAFAITEAIEAYGQARDDEALCIVERVTVLAPKPGDVVLIQLRESADMEQIEEFCQVLSENLPSTIQDVQFIGARCLEGVKIVRDEGAEKPETRSEERMRRLREFDQQVRGGGTDGN